MKESGNEVTHPCREGVETAAKIVANSFSLFWVLQNFPDLLKNRIAVGWQHVVEPVKSLNDAHRRPACPIEPARSGQLEIDDELVEVNRAEPGIGVDRDFGWHSVSESQLIRGGNSIGKKPGLLPPGDRVNDGGVIGGTRFAGERVDTRQIVESAIDTAEVARKREALEGFIDGGAGAEIEEVVRRPDQDGFVAPDAIDDPTFEVEIGAAPGHFCLSDLCRHISDRSSIVPVRKMYTFFGQAKDTTSETSTGGAGPGQSQLRTRVHAAREALAMTGF